MGKYKSTIGLILVVFGAIAMFVCAIINLCIYIENPDMTGMRRLMEFPQPSIFTIIFYIVSRIGVGMMK